MLRVLIADHRLEQALLASEFLLRRGLRVSTCGDGDSARRAVMDYHGRGDPFALVIAHHDLPGFPGLSLLYDARRCHLPTIAAAVCAHAKRDAVLVAKARKINLSLILDEPYDLWQLEELVRQLHRTQEAMQSATPSAMHGNPPRIATPLPMPDDDDDPIDEPTPAPQVAQPLTPKSGIVDHDQHTNAPSTSFRRTTSWLLNEDDVAPPIARPVKR